MIAYYILAGFVLVLLLILVLRIRANIKIKNRIEKIENDIMFLKEKIKND